MKWLLAAAVFLIPGALLAQWNTGVIEGTVRAMNGRPLAGAPILIDGGAGLRVVVHSNSVGAFSAALPYGQYQLAGATVFIPPLQITALNLIADSSGAIHSVNPATTMPGMWADDTSGRVYPEPFSLQGLLLSREPSSVIAPLDFTGLNDNRLAVDSQRGFSWTDTRFKLQGMDATDSYQPGVPSILPDIQALDAVVVRSGFAEAVSSSTGTEAGVFLTRLPRRLGRSWRGALSTANTGAGLSSTNLPAQAARGLVRQADQFRWFTRDHIEAGGPLTRRADLYASASGQWSSQTEPLAAPGTDLESRMLFANAWGRVRASERDQIDALYSGSRLNLSDGGIPAALEALTGNRMAPSFVLPGGFPGEPESDRFDFLQLGWTHLLPRAADVGAFDLRYGYSIAHLDTSTDPSGQSRIELFGGAASGAPPLANRAVRPRQQVEAGWQPGALLANGTRHRIVAGAAWQTSEPRNRFTTPSGMNLITANGAPAFTVEFNTPLESRGRVQSGSAFLADHITLPHLLAFDLGILADLSRGSLPAQSDLIVWNSLSPRAGLAWQVPESHGLVLRGTYFRVYTPLAGRYLDFANPNSLGGSAFQSPQNTLLLRFGGPYSSISPDLGRPYADEFDLGAELPLARRSFINIHLFRRDTKNRIAAIDTGVPFQAFTPVSILDPGPDGIPGTFDDQRLTVYAQNPATFGQDQYLLTNPAGLRVLNRGLLAQAGADWRGLALHASFTLEVSRGPTNPGDAVYENDPGVIGALFLDPNTAIHAAGRSFMDRGAAGKLRAAYTLPAAWGGIELASVADYLDGLAFARQLLVTGLPQGPFLVATTVRGSPEGGNRTQYAINWNLRIGREFALPVGRLGVSAGIFNVTNAGQKLQENDLSGPSFNLRLPVAIQAPRFARIGLRYEF